MKFKIIILLLLASCANYSTTSNKYVPYSSKGFAHIFYKLEDKKKIIQNFLFHIISYIEAQKYEL